MKRKTIYLFTQRQGLIGGVEKFHLNFCKRMSRHYDITFLCRMGDSTMLSDIEKHAKVEFYTGQPIVCDIFIYGAVWGILPIGGIKAKMFIQMVQADYQHIKETTGFEYKPLPNIDMHVCVGETCRLQFEKATGLKGYTIRNILDDTIKPQRVLKLVSAIRIDPAKGIDRMHEFARRLQRKNVPYLWFVYGDTPNTMYFDNVRQDFKDVPDVIFMGVRGNTADVVAMCDYTVLFTDSEGYSYTTAESLQLDTPCIVTNFKAASEMISDGINGFVVDMGLEMVDDAFIDLVYTKKLKGGFPHKETTEQNWIKVLETCPKKYKPVRLSGSQSNVIKLAELNEMDFLNFCLKVIQFSGDKCKVKWNVDMTKMKLIAFIDGERIVIIDKKSYMPMMSEDVAKAFALYITNYRKNYKDGGKV